MTFGAIHLHPAWSLPFAGAAAAWIIWYWLRLGRADVPDSRRKLRRTSLIIMLITLLMFVRGLSFVDRQTHPREYVITWSMTLLMVMLMMVTAGLDAMNNLRLHRKHAHETVHESARELVAALHNRRDSENARLTERSTDEQELSD